MLSKVSFIVTILSMLLLGNIANAQMPTTCPNDPKARMISAEQDLQAIEKIVKQIQTTAAYSEENADELLKRMDSYADNLTFAFEERLKSVERIARKNPKETKEDVGGQLESFENTAIEHSRRIMAVQKQLAEIEKNAEAGKYKLISRSQVSLLVKGFEKDTFDESEDGTNDFLGFQLVNYRSKSLNKSRVAIPCIAPCKNKNWGTCLACVAPISAQINSKWGEYSSCDSACNGKKWWQRAGCRAVCLWNFVSWVA